MDGFNDYLEEDLGLDQDTNIETAQQDTIINDKDTLFDEVSDDVPSDSLVDQLLKARGIENSLVTIIDEDGAEKEINFYELNKDEQLEILSVFENSTNEELDETEIDFVNHLRTNSLSIDDFLAQYRESIIAEMQQQNEPVYEIDAYDDHELFLLDTKTKYDLTDEELQIELEKELANPELFTKKLVKLRSEYKQLETEYNLNLQKEAELKREEDYNQFANSMVTIATNVSDYHGVFLDDDEKQETLSYLLDLNEAGVSKFSLDLNDPIKLYEAAWYLRYGAEAFKALENAYEGEIARLKKVDKPRVLRQNSDKKITTIDELF